ncbi:MAG: S6e family ribosomal protein [Candidatus Heimdallarchaeaceae archaeon]
MSQKAGQLEFKLNIGDQKGKCHTKIVRDAQANSLIGLKLGAIVEGNLIGLPSWEFTITGGSDRDGFPHRASIDGASRRKYLLKGGVGYKAQRKGKRVRKAVRGNTISEASYQINMKVLKAGSKALEELISEVSSS